MTTKTKLQLEALESDTRRNKVNCLYSSSKYTYFELITKQYNVSSEFKVLNTQF